jgi:hypothetical protein
LSNEGQFIITSANPRFESIYAAALKKAVIRERNIRASRGVAPPVDRPRTHHTGIASYARIASVMSDEPKTVSEIAAAAEMHAETARKYLSRHLAAGTVTLGIPRFDGSRDLLTYVRGCQK